MDDKSSAGDATHLDRVPIGDLNLSDGENVDRESLSHQHKRLLRQVDRRLLPLCAFLYLLNYLDRSNIGNAKLLNFETGDSMEQKVGMSATDFSLTLSLFAVAYCVFEIPSNWFLKRYARPSYWLGALLLCWGSLTLGFSGVKNLPTVIVLRFLIGVFEAGFFPGMVYLITFWYRKEERSVRIAFITATATLAGAFGGCIAYGAGFLNRKGGLEGFRWLFIIEGAVTVLITPVVFFYLPDYPWTARWLTPSVRRFAVERLEEQDGGFSRDSATRNEILATLCSPRMVAHYSAYFTNSIVMSSLTYFSPTIVQGLGYTSVQAQLMTVPPWAVGYVVSMGLAWSADHFNARGLHVFASGILAGVGFLVSSLLAADSYRERYGCLILISCGAFPSAAPLTAWVTCNVPSRRTIGLATAMNNSTVGIASIVALWIWRPSEVTQGYPTGNIVCAVSGFSTSILALGLYLFYRRQNRKSTDGQVFAL
ncbi:hypothetical protein FE257_012325 [Aspergillus nanangensis]|uniref:Major facilitator superfamily (MFS) profile domain-containing protein n=1 Tax=Aspergillus nanangensis TaxID=2582783 RepID=A0AAD4GRY6_ASPNN|nr:hypothetical protein FE257_012325 [Aspergillus nanangensis]